MMISLTRKPSPPPAKAFDFLEKSKILYALFNRIIISSHDEGKFHTVVSKSFVHLDFSDPICKNFLVLSLIYSTHLSKWDLVTQLLNTDGAASLSQGNVIFIFWKALLETQENILKIISSKLSFHLRDRENHALSLFQSKKLDQIQFHLEPKEAEEA